MEKAEPAHNLKHEEWQLFVDAREERSGLIRLLGESGLFEVITKNLEVGDIVYKDEFGIERKTGKDLIDSVKDGRLFRQLVLLKRCFFKRLLIIEGTIPSDSEISTHSVKGIVFTIVGSFGIPILWTDTTLDTAQSIERLLAHYIVRKGNGSIRERVARSPHTQDFYKRFILAGIPGIGILRANALINHFGSLERVFTATIEELTLVDQIGISLARDIRRLAG